MGIGGPVKELQLQRPGFASEHLAIAAELLSRDGGIVRRLRELDVLTGTQAGLGARVATALGEVRIGECHPDDALGAGDQLHAALVPHIPGHRIVLEAQRRALLYL